MVENGERVKERVRAKGVSSRMDRVRGRVCGFTVCHVEVEADSEFAREFDADGEAVILMSDLRDGQKTGYCKGRYTAHDDVSKTKLRCL